MGAHIGVSNTPALIAPPSGGFAHESTKDSSVEVVNTKNNLGVTVYMDQRGHKKSQVTVKGVGVASFAIVTAGSFAPDTVKVLSSKGMHELGKRAEFEYSGVMYENGVYFEEED